MEFVIVTAHEYRRASHHSGPREDPEFCRLRGIRKLSLFGSVLRDDFDPVHSDVDVLVELQPDAHPGLAYFGWAEELSQIIGHKVDLCSRLNKYIEAEVHREAVPIYEQA